MNKKKINFLAEKWITLVAFFICIVIAGCIPSKVVVSLKKNNVVEPLSINISNVQVVNHQIIITGTNLNTVTNFKIKEGLSNTHLEIESKKNNSIVANTISNVTFTAGRVFDFILSNASGASTFTVDFSLCDSQLGGKGFNCSITPTDKQVLSYDLGTGKWRPRSVNGLNYQGTWSALTALPAIGVLIPGDYYIVSVANAPYNVGDWIVLNSDGITFEQIQNAAIVTTVFGRNGNVVATENDYILDKMGDVDLSIPPITGDALIYDGSHWVAGVVGGVPSVAAGGDLAGTYPNPTIGNNNITDAHIANSAISQTKINGLVTSLSGKEPSITAAATTTYYRGDKTFVTLNSTVVPEGTNLYFTNARALGILLTGFDNTLTGQVAATDSMLQAFGRVQNQINSLGSGGGNYLVKNSADTISGTVSLTNVITATGAGDVVVNSVPLTMTSAINKTYADGKLDKTTGGVVAGIVTLDNDLKVKAGANYVTVKGNAATAVDYSFVLPVNAGTAGYLLSTDGAGNTSWITAGGGGAPTGAAGGDLSGNYPNPTITGLDAAKVGGGVVSNTEFSYLDGVTSGIQTQLNNKQDLDATLTALTAYNTNGIIVQTAVDTFAGRSVTGTSNRVSVANGNGVAGNPSVDVSTTLLPSPVVGDIGKFLKATAADTSVWSALGLSDITTALGFTPINIAGDSITTGTFTLSGTAVLRTPDPVGLTDVANKQYVDSYGQWVKSGSDVYRSAGKVGVGTTTPQTALDVAGAVRLSDDATACTAANAGAIRYNSTLNLFEKCNGSQWFAESSGVPVPANAVVLMKACDASWTDLGITGGGPGTAHCGGEHCHKCQGPATPSLVPANSIVLMESCPTNWTSLGTTLPGAPAAAGKNSLVYQSCQSPAAAVAVPQGSRVMSDSCPVNWTDLGSTDSGSLLAQCAVGVSCRVCEVPSGNIRNNRLLYGGTAGETGNGGNVSVRGGAGGTTSGPGGAINIVGGTPVDGAGGGITLFAANGATTTATAVAGGSIALTAGSGVSGGAGGSVTVNSGDSDSGTQGHIILNNLNSAAFVGIGTSSPSYKLHVVGTAGLSTGTAWTNASDIRLKDIHGDYEYGLDEILKLHTVRYSYKKDNALGLPSNFNKTGFIAQEVQKVIPDAVNKRDDGFLELNVDPIHWAVVNSIKDLYNKYILPLWESDKKQNREIASLKESNENLKKDNQKLQKENVEISERLKRIEKILILKK